MDTPTTGAREARTRISQPPPPARPASQVGSRPGAAEVAGSRPGGETSQVPTHIHVEVGDVIDNKYRVEELIGQGGMGQVLGATHLELQQKVALKFMSPAIMEIPGAVARFTREARAAAKLRSKHVCRVLDIGETPEGAKYIVIEYLEGSDLSQLLKIKEKLPTGEAIDYIVQACDALGEAHAFDIVHRDIKPANLFLDNSREGEGLLKVLDFGISKNLGGDPDMIVTATNALMGSPLYMSPEQLLSPKSVDTRADIWSLGIVLHELLVGEPPFQGETLPEVIALIVNDRKLPADAISEEIPAELRTIIGKCLQRDPVRRYRTAEQLAEALEKVAPEIAGAGRKGHALETVAPVAETPSPPWKLIAVVGSAVVVAGVLFMILRGGEKAPASAPAASPAASPAKAASPAPTPAAALTVEVAPDAAPVELPKAAEPVPAKADPVSKPKNRRRGKASKRNNKRPKEELMDPTEDRKGGRAPGDNDVMDPDL